MTDRQIQMMNQMGLSETDFMKKKTPEERIKEVETQNEMLIECLMELADIIYA